MLSVEHKNSGMSSRSYMNKGLLFNYLSTDSSSRKNHISCTEDVRSTLMVPKIDLELPMVVIGTDTDSKTATVAINTDDDVLSLNNETCLPNLPSYLSAPRMQFFQLQCMKYFVFPLYGILEKAVQTDLSMPVTSYEGLSLKISEMKNTNDKGKKRFIGVKKRN